MQRSSCRRPRTCDGGQGGSQGRPCHGRRSATEEEDKRSRGHPRAWMVRSAGLLSRLSSACTLLCRRILSPGRNPCVSFAADAQPARSSATRSARAADECRRAGCHQCGVQTDSRNLLQDRFWSLLLLRFSQAGVGEEYIGRPVAAAAALVRAARLLACLRPWESGLLLLLLPEM